MRKKDIWQKYKKSNPTKDENVIEIDEGDGDNTEDDVEPNEGQEDLDFKECKDNVLSFLYWNNQGATNFKKR